MNSRALIDPINSDELKRSVVERIILWFNIFIILYPLIIKYLIYYMCIYNNFV
ncbi:hypothetical protein ACRAD_28310 (plasmid) [Acinetobacter radioresistens DSM 6976 = NBRC 102413 = CIP 103788]|nr:hypothetical protein ACRAD_28310 [Acinetobacter radioresistens DSM 6976 = NBRC 102413 = CIP 103788]